MPSRHGVVSAGMSMMDAWDCVDTWGLRWWLVGAFPRFFVMNELSTITFVICPDILQKRPTPLHPSLWTIEHWAPSCNVWSSMSISQRDSHDGHLCPETSREELEVRIAPFGTRYAHVWVGLNPPRTGTSADTQIQAYKPSDPRDDDAPASKRKRDQSYSVIASWGSFGLSLSGAGWRISC